MPIEQNGSSRSEQNLVDFSERMLEAINELERLRVRRARGGRKTCGVVYSTTYPDEAPQLKAAMKGVLDYYSSPDQEGVVPEFKQTETAEKSWYGVDLWWL